jgi:hypothetical protein
MAAGACLGDLEEGGAFQNLPYFPAPMVMIHGGVSYSARSTAGFGPAGERVSS